MNTQKFTRLFLNITILLGLISCGGGGSKQTLSETELGKKLFFDVNLSLNRTQSCATCHDPDHAFIDSRDNIVQKAVSLGDDNVSLGDRNTPTAAYAKFVPDFHIANGEYIGGQFLDGREKDLKGQAGQPPLNPVEMGMPDKASIVARLQENNEYISTFKSLYGDSIFNNIESAYLAMSKSIAKFEKTDLFSPFDSKYDRYLRGEYTMTSQESMGRRLFFSGTETNCSLCHQLNLEDDNSKQETFANYEYHNLGIPANDAVRIANGKGATFIDHGLLDNPSISDARQDGKFKVTTLRNIAVTGPYMHNGVFQDLRTVILFYDTYNNPARIHNPETGLPWKTPEVNANLALEMNKYKFSAHKMTDEKVDALVAFLTLLTDKRYEHLIKK